MHLPWMSQSANQKYVQKFIDYALGKEDKDVWVSRCVSCNALAPCSLWAGGCFWRRLQGPAGLGSSEPGARPVVQGRRGTQPRRTRSSPPCSRSLATPAPQFVTMHQLIDWIRNPIPKDQMKEKFNVRAGLGCAFGCQGCSLSCPNRTAQEHTFTQMPLR